MIDKTIYLGTNIMRISSIMIFRTNIFSIPWRRNILTILWALGFSLFWIGVKLQFDNIEFTEFFF